MGRTGNRFESDQVAASWRVLHFARDTVRWRRPMDPDVRWPAQAGNIGTFVTGGRRDRAFGAEALDEGMQEVLDGTATPHPVDLEAIPRSNESEGHGPRRAHPVSAHSVSAHLDELSRPPTWEAYRTDVHLSGCAFEGPESGRPVREVALNKMHVGLAE